MGKNEKMADLDFSLRLRGFSGMDCFAFLCAFASLRESNSFCKRDSRKAAKTQSYPVGPKIAVPASSSQNRFF